MTRRAKLLEKARTKPGSLRFQEFETLMAHCGWSMDRQRGSHRIWKSSKGARLPVQEGRGGKAKAYQVEQFLGLFEEETHEQE